MYKHALDPNTGLLYHGWDESGRTSWADPTTHQSSVFWGRSVGWYMMALVDVLDCQPIENNSDRDDLIAILQKLTVALEKYQDQDGVWWQVVDRINANGNWPLLLLCTSTL